MAATGQTINDRLNAVRYALAGQGLARTVCKATTEEVLGPKKKHIDYLLACTDEPNISIPQLANLLIDRSQHSSWTVVFKSLITIHHLLDYGNERFTQYMATSNLSFELDDFMDRTTPQGYGMSTFVRRYAKYINSKIGSYRTLAIDLCKVKPGKENGLRTMNMENLSKTLPVVHSQFDTLLDFGAESKDLNNGIIMAAFKLLYKDLNRIFAAYQEAIINLVERYFKLSRKKTREALNMYKKYLDRMDKVSNFFKIVEQAGLDKSEMPDTSKLVFLLGVLEEHMAQLEAKKRGTNVTSPDPEDHGDEPVTPNKGSQHDSTPKDEQTKEQSTGESMKKATPEEAPSSATESAHTSGPPPKKAPPPARPSPAKLPPASQSDHKTAPPAGKAPKEVEKKAPPERPSKPPSRPPPPSGPAHAAPSTQQTSSRQEPSDSSSEQPPNEEALAQHKNDQPPPASSTPENSDLKPETNAETADETTAESAAVPTGEPATDSEPTTETVPDQAESASPSQVNGSGSQAELNNGTRQHIEPTNGEEGGTGPNQSACSNSVDRTINQELNQLQLTETNHVEDSNVENHENNVEDENPPPPPPPIDE